MPINVHILPVDRSYDYIEYLELDGNGLEPGRITSFTSYTGIERCVDYFPHWASTKHHMLFGNENETQYFVVWYDCPPPSLEEVQLKIQDIYAERNAEDISACFTLVKLLQPSVGS